jgi:hypothetical protein
MQDVTNFLDYVDNKVSPLGDAYFLTGLGQHEVDEDDEDLSGYLNGTYYPKAKQKVDDFIDRCNGTLAQLGTQLENLSDELDSALKTVKREDPGRPPNDYVDRNDPDSVDRFNRKVREYNSQLELHRRVVDQANRIRERYEDMTVKYKEKRADLEEQVIAKKEDLKPAFDKDLSIFITKISQLAFDAFQHDDKAFEGLVFAYLSKKAIVELGDRFHDANEERNATEVAKKLDLEVDKCIKTDDRPIKDGLAHLFSYLYETYKENQVIAESVSKELEVLPQKEYAFHKEDVEKILALPINTTFHYQDIIDPDELQKVSVDVSVLKDSFENHILSIDALSQTLAPTYATIEGIRGTTSRQLDEMTTNKNDVFGGRFDLIKCILEVFDDDKQDDYLPRQKQWFETLQGYIEQKEGVTLSSLLWDMTETDMLVTTVSYDLSTNSVLNFLPTQVSLRTKKQDFTDALPKLDDVSASIDRQPRVQAEAFTTQTNGWLNMSFIPIANLIMLVMLNDKISKYLSALSSTNQYFIESKEALIAKLQSSFMIHIVIALLAIGAGIFLNPLIIGLGAGYLISAVFFFVKKSSLVKL